MVNRSIILCLITGHNKILERKKENGKEKYYTVCSQCNKKWYNKQLSETVHGKGPDIKKNG